MNIFCISFSRSLQTVTRFTRASAIACAHTERELKWNAELLHGINAVLCLQIPKKKKKLSLPKWVATPHSSVAKPHTFRCGLSSMCFWWWFRHQFDDDDDDDIVIAVAAVVIVAIAITLSLSRFDCVHASFRDNLCYLYLIFGLFKRLIRSTNHFPWDFFFTYTLSLSR